MQTRSKSNVYEFKDQGNPTRGFLNEERGSQKVPDRKGKLAKLREKAREARGGKHKRAILSREGVGEATRDKRQQKEE